MQVKTVRGTNPESKQREHNSTRTVHPYIVQSITSLQKLASLRTWLWLSLSLVSTPPGPPNSYPDPPQPTTMLKVSKYSTTRIRRVKASMLKHLSLRLLISFSRSFYPFFSLSFSFTAAAADSAYSSCAPFLVYLGPSSLLRHNTLYHTY